MHLVFARFLRESTSKRHLDRFSRFGSSTACQTITTTLRATRVGNGRIYRAYVLRAGGPAKKSFAAICQR